MAESRFVYVTYIRASEDKVWEALTSPELNRKFWFGYHQDSTWEVGSPWRAINPKGEVADTGQVLEFDPPRRYAVTWRNEGEPALTAEGHTTATFVLEAVAGGLTKLTVTHQIDHAASEMIERVSTGWPKVLSGLKSLLETGQALDGPLG